MAKNLKLLGASKKICDHAESANTANEVLNIAQKVGLPLAHLIAQKAGEAVRKALKNTKTELNIMIIIRNSDQELNGELVGEAENNA